MTHNDCELMRGIKVFNCNVCRQPDSNYSNGIEICPKCCEKMDICQICGKPMIETIATEQNKIQ